MFGARYHMALSSAVRQCILRHVEWDKNLEPAVTKNFLQRMSTMGAHEMYDNFLTLLPVRYQSRCNAVIAAPLTLCVYYFTTSAQTFSGKLDLRVNSSMAEFAPAPEGPLSDTDRVAALQHDSQPLTQDEYSPFGNPTASHYRFTAGNNMDKVRRAHARQSACPPRRQHWTLCCRCLFPASCCTLATTRFARRRSAQCLRRRRPPTAT